MTMTRSDAWLFIDEYGHEDSKSYIFHKTNTYQYITYKGYYHLDFYITIEQILSS